MVQTLYATFDGQVFRPDESVGLRPNTRVRVTIEAEDEQQEKKNSFLQTARSLKLRGPSDWSSRLEDYLYEKEMNQ